MKKMIALAVITASLVSGNVFAATAEERMDALEKQVQSLEYQSYAQFFKLGGTLETQYNSTKVEDKKAWTSNKGDGTPVVNGANTSDRNRYFQLFFNLNMESNPTDKLSFFGRLSTTKYFNVGSHTGTYADNGSFSELSQGASGAYSSAVYLERAFGNYKILDNLIFTMGRLPTIDGPPKHFSAGEPMMGNYPIFGFAGIFDGIALTYAMPMLGGSMKAKAIYTPFSTLDFGNVTNSSFNSAGQKWDSSADAYSLILEYEKEQLSFARKFSSIFQLFYQDEALPLSASGKTLGLSGTTPSVCASPTECPTIVTQSNLTLQLTRFVLHLELIDIMNTGVDFSVQGMTGKTKSRGLLRVTSAGGTVFSGGWLTGNASDDMKGNAFVVNLRYKIPVAAINNPYIGYEYLKANKSAFLYDSAGTDPIGFYTTRGGDGHHVYIIEPFANNFKARVGYMVTKRTTANGIFGLIGPNQAVDRTRTGVYTNVSMSF